MPSSPSKYFSRNATRVLHVLPIRVCPRARELEYFFIYFSLVSHAVTHGYMHNCTRSRIESGVPITSGGFSRFPRRKSVYLYYIFRKSKLRCCMGMIFARVYYYGRENGVTRFSSTSPSPRELDARVNLSEKTKRHTSSSKHVRFYYNNERSGDLTCESHFYCRVRAN